ncbi:TraB/GumN family protein [Gelatiniphilus marinus]|uniref:TraB/GumN family protein n=1 Tax=Gelatiniphilus marinus TaxID=1759464 RepID=A0ABW5JVC3_9FLAO
MNKILYLAILLISCHLSAQQKYQSLLWEISGNGLEKSSYLYGTMHVSKKVAFRLDDVFFETLNKSECVALESDPSTWLAFSYNSTTTNSGYRYYGNNFYSNLFRLKAPTQLAVRNSIRIDNRLISGYLYRKSYGFDNFEEETYLDMFIYQAGKKQNKPIVGLEDLAESRYLTTKARYNSNKKKPDAWLQKRFKKENAFLIQENTYRERNLDLLDSIGVAVNTPFFREYMLYKRNENMVDVLDSLMHKKSVFSGVGAAHLPGEKGMINMLIEKGYTVKPLVSKQTNFGKSEKNKLENLFIKPKLSLQTTPDKLLSIKSFDSLREFSNGTQKFYLAPDMTNGAFLAIKRISTFEYLPHHKPIALEKINDLLYEDIPGTILEKKEIKWPFPGLSILNKTKKGDYQKYHIYKTPLEVIIIKFGGKKDFVKNYEADIFNSITFKPLNKEFTTFNDAFKKYSFTFPNNYITNNIDKSGKKLIQANLDDDYYFFQESPHHDVNYIEEDAFEAKYIHTAFYKDFEIEETNGSFENGDYKSYVSSAIIDTLNNRKLWLKSVVKDNSYYLLGYSGKNEAKAKAYFNSLKFKASFYESLKQVKDTSLYFTTNSPVKALPPYISFKDKNKKPYQEIIKKTTYTSKTNQQISVTRTKFHDFKMYANIDSLWNSVNRKTKFSSIHTNHKKLEIFDENRFTENGLNIFTHKLKDTASNKIILVKYIQKQGVLYKLSALSDSISKPSAFITRFYNDFKPMDTLMGNDILEDKTQQFFDALKNNDSIVLDGYRQLKFSKKHTPLLIDALENYTFSEDKLLIKNYLLQELIENDKSETVNKFIENLYLKSYSDPNTQRLILNGLFRRKNKESYTMFLKLMHKDLPLGSKTPSLGLYDFKSDSLKTAKFLFPELLNFSTVEEYKAPIYGLLTKLIDSHIVKPKIYKPFKKQIINDAKIQIKRSLGNQKKYTYNYKRNLTLDNYTKLLFPFREEKSVKAFYLRLLDSKDWEALTTYYTLLKQNNELITNQLKSKTLYKKPAQHLLFTKLKTHNILTQEETQVIDLKTFAESKLFAQSNYKMPKDSICFLEEKTFKTDTNEDIRLFIFKRINKRLNDDNEYLHYIAFENNNTIKPYYTSRKNGVSVSGIKTDNEVIENTITLIKHKTRKRINRGY